MTENEMLANNVLFAAVTVHVWRGQYEIDGATVRVGDAAVEKTLVAEPRWKLLPGEFSIRFGRIESAIRQTVQKKALPFPLPGVYVLPRLSAGDVFAAVDAKAVELGKAADELVDKWPAIVAKLEAEVPADQWRDVKAKLPTAAGLRKKFGVTKRVVPVGGLAASTDDASAYAKEIQAMTTAFVSETARTLADGLKDELAAAASTLVDRMAAQGVVKASNLAALEDALAKLESFRFLTGPEVAAQVAVARQRIRGLTHTDLNENTRHGDGKLAAELTALVRGVTDGLAADRAFTEFGRTRRAVL